MMLDLRFSTDYYLRVLELAIRDESRILVYNKKHHLLETWPIHTVLSPDQDAMKETIQKVIQELFSRSVISYALSGRLLSIIDMRLRQELPYTRILYKIFRKDTFTRKTSVIQKLLKLKNIIFLERQRPLNKVSNVASSVFAKEKTNFSSWEDFTHDVEIHAESADAHLSVKEIITAESSSQVIMEALMTFLESQAMYLPLSLELLDQFVAEKAIPLQTLSEKSFALLSELKNLYTLSREDFQAVIGGVITNSLSAMLTNSLVGSLLFTPQGKAMVNTWQEVAEFSPKEANAAQGFLAEILRRIISEDLKTAAAIVNEATPEQIGRMYSIRDYSPGLWLKMLQMLLMRWLLDFDEKVYSLLKKSINYYTPEPSFWQQILCIFKKF
ncbi:hypothetical protein [Chlamydia abortus]|uniref:Uncharacterized protein n=1 Tax=Chlamydia abortus (strain DSM 27085 / S26/3) TaxID=218497 RepID=Q5L745_CHLAB|nr:hypothetical protein [Chlamydia abortus]ASD30257.1 hypothetical protein CEF07_00360 [Chlamydia abortus]AUS59490.1 uncharacterized protein CHAB577_0069 [Chlamydia abortus]CAH63523.1 conserved hypothetical protein [Chlamydia abortus S26/3]SFV98667.1 Uncharacterised protein [Chlamydia abortus]SFV99004.1 Uncharacterised protein [Chlamydia abortus]